MIQDANELQTKYNEVSRQLEMKYNETRIAKERADVLKDRASEMFTSIKSKVDNLRGNVIIDNSFFFVNIRFSNATFLM